MAIDSRNITCIVVFEVGIPLAPDRAVITDGFPHQGEPRGHVCWSGALYTHSGCRAARMETLRKGMKQSFYNEHIPFCGSVYPFLDCSQRLLQSV